LFPALRRFRRGKLSATSFQPSVFEEDKRGEAYIERRGTK
jgi:hypothetical protein